MRIREIPQDQTCQIISPGQIRAARGLIGWSQNQLAHATHLSRGTIIAIENNESASIEHLNNIRLVFENCRVEFLDDDGVRLRQTKVRRLEGRGVNLLLLKEVLEIATQYKSTKRISEILIYGIREGNSKSSILENLKSYMSTLSKHGLETRFLTSTDARPPLVPASAYRSLPELDTNETVEPIVVYGERLAIFQWHPTEAVIIFDSKSMSDAFRTLFDATWRARPTCG
jgi:transcriptional regulator with XRE-family HTH domain